MAQAALITGGAKRVGKAIALALAGRGFDIALHYNTAEADARATAEEVRRLGRTCEVFGADLADAAGLASLLPRVLEKLPLLRVLVNNASIFNRVTFEDSDEGEFDRNFDIHLKAPFFLTQRFARLCPQGQVVNVLDTKIAKPNVNFFAYTLSKKALAAFTEMAAVALAPDIRVNGVCPGMTLAPEGTDPEYLQKLSQKLVPLRRQGAPRQIADAVVYLVESDYVTGQILYVDGGEHLM